MPSHICTHFKFYIAKFWVQGPSSTKTAVDAPVAKHLVYDKLFVYDDTYPKVNRPPLQVFTREMGIACAKRLMSKYPEEPSLGTSDRWEFNPIHYEVLVRSHNSLVTIHRVASTTTIWITTSL